MPIVLLLYIYIRILIKSKMCIYIILPKSPHNILKHSNFAYNRIFKIVILLFFPQFSQLINIGLNINFNKAQNLDTYHLSATLCSFVYICSVSVYICVCVYVYVYVCMCICICVYIYMYICICMLMRVYVYIFMFMLICIYILYIGLVSHFYEELL